MRRSIIRAGAVRKQRYQRYAIKQWADRLPDVPAFLIGNGPSINKQDLSLLEDYFTIGINRAFYALDTTLLMWQDISLWNSEYHKLQNIQALKVARDIADPRRIYYNFHLKTGPYSFSRKTHVLYGRGSSGPIAAQLAHSMGGLPLILVGMDCQLDADGKTDFYGNNDFWLPHTLDACNRGLEFIREECPVEIINCSNNDFWEKVPIAEALERVDPTGAHKRGRQSYVKQILRLG